VPPVPPVPQEIHSKDRHIQVPLRQAQMLGKFPWQWAGRHSVCWMVQVTSAATEQAAPD
jgi:hypothetical protein